MNDLQGTMEVLLAREEKHYRVTLNPYYFKPTLMENLRKPWIKYFFASSGMCQDDRTIGEYAAFYLDRATVVYSVNTVGEYHKLALSVSHLSLKLHGHYGLYSYEHTVKGEPATVKDMEENEGRILRAMTWNMHPPVPSFFVKEYLKGIEDCADIAVFIDVTKKLFEIVVCSVQTTKFKPSAIAVAGMTMAATLMESGRIPSHLSTIIEQLQLVSNKEALQVYSVILSGIQTENMKRFLVTCHEFHHKKKNAMNN